MAKSKTDALNALLAEASQKSGEVTALLTKAGELGLSLLAAGQAKAKKAGETWLTFSDWLKAKMDQHGLTPPAVASTAGVPYSSVRGYLNRQAKSPSIGVALKIAKVFDADANELYGVEEFFKESDD